MHKKFWSDGTFVSTVGKRYLKLHQVQQGSLFGSIPRPLAAGFFIYGFALKKHLNSQTLALSKQHFTVSKWVED